tara:strand:- start:885 stop:3119 length:2235 start_codon:yes stop_codon:yes gene_type:complete
MRILYFIILFTLYSFLSSAEVINDVVVKNNKRITKETIITLGDINLGENYEKSDLDKVLKNLYNTNFFSDIKVSVENNTLTIFIEENKIIQSIVLNGIKANRIKEAILEDLLLKERSPFIKIKVKQDVARIKNGLTYQGYYFSKVNSSIKENANDTVDLIYDIKLGKKAKISRVEFLGDKKFKNKKLRNLIVSEENKFWKFISKKRFLNKDQIDRDERLLKNFYLNRGYYDVVINATSAQYLDDDSFVLTFNIDAGESYQINKTNLILPIDYKKSNFTKIEKLLSELENETYSFRKISKIVEQVDKVSLLREYDFISASINEEKIENNKINLTLEVMETERFYVKEINILGNDITLEHVIRDSLEIDEGDPFNELLHAKSINNLKAKNIFGAVSSDVLDGPDLNTKIININVEEKPTGEISIAAGVGTEGGTAGFNISENNFMGRGVKLSASLRISEDTIRGNFTTYNPNYNYSGKGLSTNIQSTVTDKMADSGYDSTKTGFSFGTSVEQYEDLFFSPSFSTYYERLTTNDSASDNLKKQEGSYFDMGIAYTLDYDKRNQKWQTSEGYRSKFTQRLPVISEEYAFLNGYEITKYVDLENDLITKFAFYGKTINSLTGDDVRVSDRLKIPRSKLKGFVAGGIGPIDDNDFVGGNHAAAINFSSTLPMILESYEDADFKFFIDAANVWGVDYSSTIDDSNKIRSSTGVSVDWFTPIGPLNFSLAQPITKLSTDKTESFQFNLGTTF